MKTTIYSMVALRDVSHTIENLQPKANYWKVVAQSTPHFKSESVISLHNRKLIIA